MIQSEMSVILIDRMGSDLSVVNAARVSFDKESAWHFQPSGMPNAGQKFLSEADTKLIGYLAKHNHWSPFAHTSIQLRIKAPIFVARHLVKHHVGGVWNEVSRRYVDSEPEFYFPTVWRGRPVNAKQGSEGIIACPYSTCIGYESSTINVEELVEVAYRLYTQMIKEGFAPEQARMILPQNMMTEWYWTGSLMFFARVYKERLASGAQEETRQVAELIRNVARELFPISWRALQDG